MRKPKKFDRLNWYTLGDELAWKQNLRTPFRKLSRKRAWHLAGRMLRRALARPLYKLERVYSSSGVYRVIPLSAPLTFAEWIKNNVR